MEDVLKYWQEMAKQAGLAEEAIVSISSLVSDPEKGKVFQSAFVPRPDVDKALSAEKSRAAKAAKDVETLDGWINQQAMPYVKGIEQQVKAYQKLYGELDPEVIKDPDSHLNRNRSGSDLDASQFDRKYLSKEEAVALLKERDSQVVDLWKDSMGIMSHYYSQFGSGEAFPHDEFVGFAENLAATRNSRVRAMDAYKEFIAPRMAELEKARSLKHDKEIREDERQKTISDLSKRSHPLDTGPREPHPLFDGKPSTEHVRLSDADLMAEFNQGWNEAGELRKPSA